MASQIIDTFSKILDFIFTPIINSIIIAVIIILIGFIIGRIAGKISAKFLKDIELNKMIRKGTSLHMNFEKGISLFLRYFIYFVAIIWALETLNIATTILYVVSTAIIVVVVLSILLGIKDFFPNLIARIFITNRSLLKKGDHIQLEGITGEVIEMSLVEIKVKTNTGDIIFIPNSTVLKSTLKVKKK